jgi:hypothetical protein
MAKDLGTTTAVTPVLGQDGVVYFDYVPIPIRKAKPITERQCQWTLAFLWALAAAWAVAALLWF